MNNAGNVVIPMSVLLGDTTGSGSVNSTDVSQTKAQSGSTASISNFRTDVTVNGSINSSDVSTVKSKSGTALYQAANQPALCQKLLWPNEFTCDPIIFWGAHAPRVLAFAAPSPKQSWNPASSWPLKVSRLALSKETACVDSSFRERSLRFMSETFSKATRTSKHHGVTRRKFLGTTIAGGAAVLAGGSFVMVQKLAAAASPTAKSSFLIGGDLSVNRLGFGAMRLTGEGIWGWPADRENARKVLRRAVELGVNFIDTADAYGPEVNELLIAEALHPYPAGLVIATKGGNTRPGPNQWVPDGRPEYLTQCVEKSLKRLKLDRIDLYQLHRIDPKVPVEDSLGALKKMQDAGKIRHVGLSEVSVKEIERARKVLPIVSVQNQYNIEDRDYDDVIAYCEKEKLGFIPWSPIGGGRGSLRKPDSPLAAEAKRHGASVVQLALAWLLQRSPVMLPIPGTSSLAHLEENMASAKIQLKPDEWKAVEELAKRVRRGSIWREKGGVYPGKGGGGGEGGVALEARRHQPHEPLRDVLKDLRIRV